MPKKQASRKRKARTRVEWGWAVTRERDGKIVRWYGTPMLYLTKHAAKVECEIYYIPRRVKIVVTL